MILFITLPDGQRQNDLPYKFYGLSDEGRRFLDEHGLIQAEETFTEVYDSVEKTDTIKQYETAPRPDH